GDVNANPTLRLAVQRAKDARMPNDNIDKAIKKGTGEDTSTHYEEVTYEGFGPEGGALLIKTITDNKNRTVSELRNIFNRAGGSLGGPGSAAYIFAQDPQNPTYKVTISHEDKAEAIDGLIETLEDHDDVQEVYHNYDF
nr:YebC/PmpR family DNA-binding transcriptional regulator [Patescibacteria group bacterium]